MEKYNMFIDNFLKEHVFWWILNHYYPPNFLPLDGLNTVRNLNMIESITLKDGCTYKMNRNARFVAEQSIIEYDWSDFKESDIVLDIGASIGGFTIPAAKKTSMVFSFEPIATNDLNINIENNGVKSKVKSFKGMLGDPSKMKYQVAFFDEIYEKNVSVFSFKDMMNIAGGKIDFLKCDCEGAEKYICPDDLLGIRRIEIELHNITDEKIKILRNFINTHWKTYETIGNGPINCITIHAFEKKEKLS